jgi:hypothetical protein
LTNGLEPPRVSGTAVLRLSPWRWNVERRFVARQEVLPLPRFYTGSPNDVALPV